MKGNDEIHRLRHHSSLKLFLPTAENEKAHNLWIKLTFTKCQCQLDRQGWLERFMSKSTKYQVHLDLVFSVAQIGREHRTICDVRGVTFKVIYIWSNSLGKIRIVWARFF